MVFEEFRKFQHEQRPRLEGREQEWCAKGPSHVLRLAGTLAYLDWSMRGGGDPTYEFKDDPHFQAILRNAEEPSEISEVYMRRAVDLWRGLLLASCPSVPAADGAVRAAQARAACPAVAENREARRGIPRTGSSRRLGAEVRRRARANSPGSPGGRRLAARTAGTDRRTGGTALGGQSAALWLIRRAGNAAKGARSHRANFAAFPPFAEVAAFRHQQAEKGGPKHAVVGRSDQTCSAACRKD